MTRLQKLTEEMHKCFRCNLCKMIPMPVVRNPDFMDAKRHLVNMALREHVVEESHALPAHEETIRNWRERGHQRGAAAALAGQWARGLGLKQLPGERADVLLFAGCRGGRGGVPAAFPALAASAARERVREAGAVGGAEALVTACHECRVQLALNANFEAGGGLPVPDVVDLVQQAAGIPE